MVCGSQQDRQRRPDKSAKCFCATNRGKQETVEYPDLESGRRTGQGSQRQPAVRRFEQLTFNRNPRMGMGRQGETVPPTPWWESYKRGIGVANDRSAPRSVRPSRAARVKVWPAREHSTTGGIALRIVCAPDWRISRSDESVGTLVAANEAGSGG